MGIKGLIKELYQGKNTRLNKQISVFLVCILISTLFWVLTSLSGEFTIDLHVNAEYTNVPDDRVLVDSMPKNLRMEVSAYGFDLIGYKLQESDITVDIDLQKLKTGTGKDGRNFILLETHYGVLGRQIDAKARVSKIFPNRLSYRFDYKVSKKLPVRLTGDLDFRQQFQLMDSIKISPDSVLVSGASVHMKSLEYIATVPLNLKDMAETTTHVLKLDPSAAGKDVVMDVEEVKVTIPVEQFTEDRMEIPVELLNIPDSLNIRILPHVVNVVYKVGLSKFEKVDSSMFRVGADLSEVRNPDARTLKVKLLRHPDFTVVNRIDPARVEYMIILE